MKIIKQNFRLDVSQCLTFHAEQFSEMHTFWTEFENVKESWWPIIVASLISIIAVIRMYIGGTQCPSLNRIDGKTVIITGGSSGIGLATAIELAKRGASIILAVRNAERGKQAIEVIKRECSAARAIIKMVDLADFGSIREFANQMKMEYDKIDILINNAGIIFHPYKRTVDGNELTISTNYLGPFLLTHLLLPLLNKAEDGRVINISAVAHLGAKINIDDLNSERQFGDLQVFGQSKLALTMFTKQMASLLRYTHIKCNAVNPGLVRGTDHLRNSKLMISFFTKFSVWPWMWLFMKTPKQGCQTVIYAAIEPTLNNISGCYFNNCAIEEPAELVKDVDMSEKLYKKTCEMVGIQGETIVEKLGTVSNKN